MNYAAPRLSIADIENGRLDAPSKWAEPLKRLIAEGLVDDDNVCKWKDIGVLHSDQFAKQLRKQRGKGPFELKVWSSHKGKFADGTDTDVSRLINPGWFSPLDLCDFHLLKPEKVRLEDYISWVRKLFEDRRCQESAGNIVNAIGAALRKAAKVADDAWDATWFGCGQPLQKTVGDIEKTIRCAIEEALGQTDFFWITERESASPDKSGRVFLLEALGGERNFERRVPFYTISIVAADVTRSAAGLSFAPVCSGVYVPALQHLYLGVPGAGGGAVLIDERLTAVHKLSPSSQRIGNERVTVGIHHSRNEVLLSNQFVNLVSCLLPSWVDKEIATGAGAWSMAMTASGSLAAYFESSISWPAAFAGAVLLYAATGQKDAATDLTNANWVEGDPTHKRGILAWGHTGLKGQIGQAVAAGCRILSTMRS